MNKQLEQTPKYLIEARVIRKAFGDELASVEALSGVDLALSEGEFVAIMGPSGSGKSSLLHILGGIDTPTSGQLLLEGVDLASLDDDRRTKIPRTRIGFIFQAFNLLPNLTAEDNVSLPLELGGMSAAEARRRAAVIVGRYVATRRASAWCPFGRRATARGHRAGLGYRAGPAPGRRT